MESKSAAVLFSLFLCLVPFPAVSDPELGGIDVRSTIRIGGDNHLPPYQYVNDNGIYKGFSIDIANAIALQTGVDIEFHPMPWYEIPREIGKGGIDVVLGMSRIDAPDSSYSYSKSYLTMADGIFVRNDNLHISSFEDLSDVRVAVQKGNVPARLFDHVRSESVDFLENQQQGILMLMMGQIDAFVGNVLVGKYTIQKWRQTNFIKLVGEPIDPLDCCFAAPEKNKNLIKVFDEGLRQLKANGTYGKIYEKWFGEIIQRPEEIRGELLKKVLLVLGAILVVFLFVFRTNRLLKREVGRRTLELDTANMRLLENHDRMEREYLLREQILNSILSSIITLEANGMISFCNSKARGLFDLLGDGAAVGRDIHDTSIGRLVDFGDLTRVLENGETFIRQERELGIEGNIYTYHCSMYPINLMTNMPCGAIISLFDITTEKAMQTSLIHKDKMSALGQLAAGVAHEIRNPLMSIKTFIDLIPQKLDSEKFRSRLLKYVPIEIDRLNNLTTDLLNYSKPHKSLKEKVFIQDLVCEVSDLFYDKIKDERIRLVPEIEAGAFVYSDRYQIKQVLINLLLNSLNAVKAGGTIRIRTIDEADRCRIQVIDDGAGIPAKYREKVTEPFFSLNSDGSGLGLFICYQLIRGNAGDIVIESEEGRGTEVSVILPKSEGCKA